MREDFLSNIKPTEFCERQTVTYVEHSEATVRKKKGQFFTPAEIAKFMAKMSYEEKSSLRVIDPGAGTGMLSCAVCELAYTEDAVSAVTIDAYENDATITPYLHGSLQYAHNWLKEGGVDLSYRVLENDFLLTSQHDLRTGKVAPYDLAIGNPPYFKIGGKDPRALAAKEFVFGQPNVYSLFMGLAAKALKKGGVLVFITPRSFTAGQYFKAFRKCFFKIVRPERIHLFESRKDAFGRGLILQENVILRARRADHVERISISHSKGLSDLKQSSIRSVPYDSVVAKSDADITVRIPISSSEDEILQLVDEWNFTLHKHGLEISTGPVVPFRATNLLVSDPSTGVDLAPLIWMHNVRPMEVKWSNNHNRNSPKRPVFIKSNAESRGRKLVVNNSTMVLLHRFSSKEQRRRLVAAPLFESELDFSFIGIENHLNYIWRPGGSLTPTEALGLSALLNSSVLDGYFRTSNGNTQVSSTELRAMPFPPPNILLEIASKINSENSILSLETIDNIVSYVIQTVDFSTSREHSSVEN